MHREVELGVGELDLALKRLHVDAFRPSGAFDTGLEVPSVTFLGDGVIDRPTDEYEVRIRKVIFDEFECFNDFELALPPGEYGWHADQAGLGGNV